MIVDDERANKRLNAGSSVLERLGKGNRINHGNAGRNEGDNNLTPILRSIISAAGHMDTAKNVAANFGISESHAHVLKHGKTSSTSEVKEEIVLTRNELLDKTRDRAVTLLMESLNLITPEKLDKAKVREISSVAKDMASIIEKTTPVNDAPRGPQILILTVPQKEAKDYKIVEVESKVIGESDEDRGRF